MLYRQLCYGKYHLDEKDHDIALTLRELGFGVTETLSEGSGGFVSMLRSVVSRQQLPELLASVYRIDTDSFVTVEEVRAVHRGCIRAAHHQK